MATEPKYFEAANVSLARTTAKDELIRIGDVPFTLKAGAVIVGHPRYMPAVVDSEVPAPPTRTEEPEKVEVRLREVIASTIAARDSAKDFWKIETHDELANFYRGQFSAYTSMVNYLERVVGELFPPERP